MQRILKDKPTLNELYHHGVLGMKWGVRKEDQFSRTGGRIKAGTKFTRYSRSDNEDKRSGVFVYKDGSLEKEFEDSYINKTIIPYVKKSRKEVYKYSMTTKVDLITPSQAERGKVFVDTFLKNHKNWNVYLERDQPISPENMRFYEGMRKNALSDYNKQMLLNGEFTLSSKFGREFTKFGGKVNDKGVRDLYITSLKAKGYNAVIDDNDLRVQREYQSLKVEKELNDKIKNLSKDQAKIISEYNDEWDKTGTFDIKSRLNLYKKYKPQIKDYEKNKSLLKSEIDRKDLTEDFDGGSFIIFDRENVNEKVTKITDFKKKK